jgi:hypothetical protein
VKNSEKPHVLLPTFCLSFAEAYAVSCQARLRYTSAGQPIALVGLLRLGAFVYACIHIYIQSPLFSRGVLSPAMFGHCSEGLVYEFSTEFLLRQQTEGRWTLLM